MCCLLAYFRILVSRRVKDLQTSRFIIDTLISLTGIVLQSHDVTFR